MKLYNKLLLFFLLMPFALSAQKPFLDKYERIYSLSEIWKELDYNFAFPDKSKEANLDSLYQAYLPKVENAEDTYTYYRVLSSFMAAMNEAHTRILPPEDLPYDMPSVITSNIGKHVFVKNVDVRLQDVLPLYSEVICVNRIPVVKFLKDSVYQYTGASTSHWKFDKAVTEMLYGRPDSKVSLTIKTRDGKVREVELVRDYLKKKDTVVMADNVVSAPLSIEYLDGGIGYIHLSTCVGTSLKEIQRMFYRHLEKLINCKGLIIDVRDNRGGTDQAWYLLAYCSMPGETFGNKGKWITRKHVASYKMHGQSDESLRKYYEGKAMEEIVYSKYKNGVPDSLKLKQPMVILSGQYTGSAAEDFVQLMKENKRAVIVGAPTVGCMGEPTFIDLPGGYIAMISVKAYIAEDGSQPNDTGILPDVMVEQTYADFLNGKDTQLEEAVRILKDKNYANQE